VRPFSATGIEVLGRDGNGMLELDVWPQDLIDRYHHAHWWDERTVSGMVAALASERPGNVAFVGGDGRTMSWDQYDREASHVASVLIGLGMGRGNPVAVAMADTPELHAAYVGAERAGAVVVAIGRRAGYHHVRQILARTGCDVLVTRADSDAALGRSLADRLHREGGWSGHHVEVRGDDEFAVLVNGEAPRVVPDPLPDYALGADELFLLSPTSGTTGTPKWVMHTQNRWKYFHRQCPHFRPDDVFLVAVPIIGGFGLWMSHFSPLMVGVPTIVLPQFSPEATLEALERHRATVLAAVPTQLIMMMHHPLMASTDFTSLRITHSGGEHVPMAEAMQFEQRTGSAVLQFYGSTEAGCVSGPTRASDTVEQRLGTAGRVIPEMNVRLFDPSGNDVTSSGRGQCAARGPALCPGYFDDDRANAVLYRPDGWLMLGDIVEVDTEGFLRVVGRASDFIIRAGLNISAAEVEDCVRRHPRVHQVAAVAMPDPTVGERVCAFIVTDDDQPLALDQLVGLLERDEVPKYLWPERIECVPSLPMVAGKVAKASLRQQVRELLASE
jgi:acyl-CoA synthetase